VVADSYVGVYTWAIRVYYLFSPALLIFSSSRRMHMALRLHYQAMAVCRIVTVPLHRIFSCSTYPNSGCLLRVSSIVCAQTSILRFFLRRRARWCRVRLFSVERTREVRGRSRRSGLALFEVPVLVLNLNFDVDLVLGLGAVFRYVVGNGAVTLGPW
jgi:hypothetical protein